MMEFNIFSQRKELKKRGHATVRRHYIVLTFLMLAMVMFGTEFKHTLSSWGKNPIEQVKEYGITKDPGSALSDDDALLPSIILKDITGLDLSFALDSSEESERRLDAFKEKYADSKALGMTNGVLAQMVTSVVSGRLFIKLLQTIYTITRSKQAANVLFILGAFLWYFLIYFLIKNVYSAVMRRVFLCARVYKNLTAQDLAHFALVRKWVAACWTLLVRDIYHFFWWLTIVGGIIKEYSYWAVPYIVAENPSLKPKEAIALSRKMMDGHKMELFVYELTFIGWFLLNMVTYGVSDLVYGNTYRLCAQAEFYAALRKAYLEKEPDAGNLLNDPYLFRQADRFERYEVYFDVVDEMTDIYEKKVEPTGWRKIVAKWFGVWLYSTAQKRAYDSLEERKLAVRHEKYCMKGEAYPQRLNPLWKTRKTDKQGQFSFIRSYTVWTLILLFIAFCFVGWSWEVALHYMQTGQFANRGTLHGPWLPIYGTGGIIVLILCSRFRKNPVVEFFVAIVLCGILEYTAAWSLETRYHQRWWSYDGYFLNLHGRICAEGLLVFGVGCCIVVYLVAPGFDFVLSKVKEKILIVLCAILGSLYMVDVIYSSGHPNMAEGAIEAVVEETEAAGGAAAGAETEAAADIAAAS